MKKHYKNISNVKIIAIDSISLTNHFLITAIETNNKIKIISNKDSFQTYSCDHEIIINQEYEIVLKKLNILSVDDSLNMRLYQNGIFVNGKEILDKNTEVFISPSLYNLCSVLPKKQSR